MDTLRYILCTGESYAYMETDAASINERPPVQPITAYLYGCISDGSYKVPVLRLLDRYDTSGGDARAPGSVRRKVSDTTGVNKEHLWYTRISDVPLALREKMLIKGYRV